MNVRFETTVDRLIQTLRALSHQVSRERRDRADATRRALSPMPPGNRGDGRRGEGDER